MPQNDVIFDACEAQAVLYILDQRVNNQPIHEKDWQVLFQCDGYRRLKEREASIDRPFEDSEFISFVTSDDLLSRCHLLKETLTVWQRMTLQAVIQRSLAYLPSNTVIAAKVYPVIKPKTNSFVFDLGRNPAIFLYHDPNISLEQLENILAHEFHHIGLGTAQVHLFRSEEWKSLPEAVQQMYRWAGAFGEGIAMLAAAGSPDIHPHACSNIEDRDRWDQSMENFEADFHQVEAFLLSVREGQLTGQAMIDAGMQFFGIQGPWYTVGWKMAVTIEQAMGRDAIIAAFCDPRQLFSCYNRAAGSSLPHWHERLCQSE